MTKKWRWLAGFALLLIIMPLGISSAEEKEADGEEFGPHRIELFLGNTHDEGENIFTIGVGYEYRVNQWFGVGGLIEGLRGEVREWIVVVPFYLHPYKGWRFVLAPGIEGQIREHREFLIRVGAAYEFEIGRWSITPEFNLDFVDGREVPVFGVSFGYGF